MKPQPSSVMIVSNRRVQKFWKLFLRSEEITQPNWSRHVKLIFVGASDGAAFVNGFLKLSFLELIQILFVSL